MDDMKIRYYLHNFLTDSEQKILIFFLIMLFSGFLIKQTPFAYAEKTDSPSTHQLKESIKTPTPVHYDLNSISLNELLSIKGIGPKKAEDILKFQKDPGFKSVEDLLQIKGIGEKTFQKLSPNFYIVKNDQKVFADSTRITSTDAKALISSKIYMNTASVSELMSIKGIGKKKAEAIIEYHKLHPIKSYEDFLNIKGIGPKLLLTIKESIILEEQTQTAIPQKENTETLAQSTQKININTADLQQLTTIKGIGPKKAQSIIDYRNKMGSYKSLDQLLEVDGIGQKTLQHLKEYLFAGEADDNKK